jgi:hypothetical protein
MGPRGIQEGNMEIYKFVFNDKTYELNEGNCDDFLNDETVPVSGIELSNVLELLNEGEEVNFTLEYYDQPCSNCLAGKAEKEKYFKFLEYFFYIFTKDGKYVMSNLSKEYKNTSFTRLQREGKVDNSYIISAAVCINCGNYSVEIEQCEI